MSMITATPARVRWPARWLGAALVLVGGLHIAAGDPRPLQETKELSLVVWPERGQLVEQGEVMRYGFDVRDQSGHPVPAAVVRISDGSQVDWTPASVPYESHPKPAGSFKLTFRAEAPGAIPSREVVRELEVTEPKAIGSEIALKYPQGDVVLQGREFVMGALLVSSLGGVVPGVPLELAVDEGRLSAQATTGPDGRAVFPIPTDRLRIGAHGVRVIFRGGTVGGRVCGAAERFQQNAFRVESPRRTIPALQPVEPPSLPPFSSHVQGLLEAGRFEDARQAAKGLAVGHPAESKRVQDALDDVVRNLPDQTGVNGPAQLLRRSVQGFLEGGPAGERQALLCALYANQVSSGTAGVEWMRFLKGEYPGRIALVLPRDEARPLMDRYLEIIDSTLNTYGYEEKFSACEDILMLEPSHVKALRVLGSVHFSRGGRHRKAGDAEKAREEFGRARRAWEKACRLDPQDGQTRQFLQAVERMLDATTPQRPD